jgi:hypothetical protein
MASGRPRFARGDVRPAPGISVGTARRGRRSRLGVHTTFVMVASSRGAAPPRAENRVANRAAICAAGRSAPMPVHRVAPQS